MKAADLKAAVNAAVDERLAEMIPVAVMSNRFVSEKLAAAMLGISVASIRWRRGKNGTWAQGQEWRKDDAGSVWIDIEAVNKRIEQS